MTPVGNRPFISRVPDATRPRTTRNAWPRGGLEKVIFHISDEPTLEHRETYKAAREVVVDLLDGCTVVDAMDDLRTMQLLRKLTDDATVRKIVDPQGQVTLD